MACTKMKDLRQTVSRSNTGNTSLSSFNLHLILKELVSNIIRHASAEQVRVQVEFLPTQWNILIEDNGLGFQRHAVQGNGLHNIETRAAEIGARVLWQGELQRGTRCHVSLPFHLLRPTSPLV
jgi:signal transduction histidine kinase